MWKKLLLPSDFEVTAQAKVQSVRRHYILTSVAHITPLSYLVE